MADTKLRDVLSQRHSDYIERLAEWNLLADSWSGRGGFLPPLDQAEWGAAGPKWSASAERSYIVPFTRERYAHWQQRVRTATYINHYRRIADTILGFMRRNPITIADLPPDLEEWRKNADGLGHSLDSLISGAVADALMEFGYCLPTVDRPDVPARNGAEAREPGLSTFAAVRDPRSMIAWDVDAAGQLAWTRFEEHFVRWPNPMASPEQVTRWTLWTPREVAVWELVENVDEDGEKDAALLPGFPRPNPTGVLPVIPAFYSGPQQTFAPADAPLLSTAFLGLWLFNRSSEETDLFRQRGFPILCWPVKQGQTPRGIKAGTDNAIPYPSEGNVPLYLTPDGSTAANYDVILRRGTGDIYEQSRTDFARRTTGQVESAAAQQTRFQAMNAGCVSFGQSLVEVAKGMCRLAVLWNAPEGQTVDPDKVLAGAKFEAPENYDVEDLDRELGQMETGLRIGLGPTAEAEIRKQARDRLVTLQGKQLDDSNAEIEAEAAAQRKRDAGGEETPPAEAADLDNPLAPPIVAPKVSPEAPPARTE